MVIALAVTATLTALTGLLTVQIALSLKVVAIAEQQRRAVLESLQG